MDKLILQRSSQKRINICSTSFLMEEALISVPEESASSSHMVNLLSGLAFKMSYLFTRLSFMITSRRGETVNAIAIIRYRILP